MGRPLYNLGAFRAALTAARILPRSAARFLAQGIASALLWRNPDCLAALRQNLTVVTGRTGVELETLCRGNARRFAAMLADYFYCSSRPLDTAATLLGEWHGIEHLCRAREAGKGIILITGHLGNWELGGSLLVAQGIPMTVVTLEEPSGALTDWRQRYRREAGIHTIVVGPGREFAMLEMIQVLRRNECLAMLVDRPYGGAGSPVHFFGRSAEFSTAPAVLWQHTRAAVIPAFVTGGAGGRYRAFAEPALDLQSAPDSREAMRLNTQTVASAFESVIRQHADQWFNYAPIWLPSPGSL
jgi:lauroyl/myristoyl acyltransferase